MTRSGPRPAQRGGFILGLIVGLLVGLAVALGVALYIAKVPVPFMDKVGHRTAEQDAAESERLKSWDPNAGLAGKQAPRPLTPPAGANAGLPAPGVGAGAEGAASAAQPASAPAARPRSMRDPAAILSGEASGDAKAAPGSPSQATPSAPAGTGAADSFVYFVQAGAYSNATDAEQQRARLALQGVVTRVTERDQGGRTVYRVRLGPFETREESEKQQDRLKDMGTEAALVRAERPKP